MCRSNAASTRLGEGFLGRAHMVLPRKRLETPAKRWDFSAEPREPPWMRRGDAASCPAGERHPLQVPDGEEFPDRQCIFVCRYRKKPLTKPITVAHPGRSYLHPVAAARIISINCNPREHCRQKKTVSRGPQPEVRPAAYLTHCTTITAPLHRCNPKSRPTAD